MSDTNVCKQCAAEMQRRDEAISAARRALAVAIDESEKRMKRYADDEDFANALTARAYLNGLQVALAILDGAEVGK